MKQKHTKRFSTLNAYAMRGLQLKYFAAFGRAQTNLSSLNPGKFFTDQWTRYTYHVGISKYQNMLIKAVILVHNNVSYTSVMDSFQNLHIYATPLR